MHHILDELEPLFDFALEDGLLDRDAVAIGSLERRDCVSLVEGNINYGLEYLAEVAANIAVLLDVREDLQQLEIRKQEEPTEVLTLLLQELF